MSDIPEEGMKVHVFSADKTKDLGLGTIEKVEPFLMDGIGVISKYPSRIALDSGEVTEGLNCWWILAEKEKEILKKKEILIK